MTSYDPTQLQGTTAVGPDGEKIGAVKQVYINDTTNEPEWVTVSTGLLGTKESFAPLSGSRLEGDTLVLAVGKDVVKGAPNIDDDGHTGEQEQNALYDYYSSYAGSQSQAQDNQQRNQPADRDRDSGTADRNRSGDLGAGEAITRSEEQLRVGTEQVEAGRARIHKYVVTENVTQTVPVSREELRVERTPITDAAAAPGELNTEIGDSEHELTLHAERPVLTKETVPVEQVKIGTETVTDQETVNEEVRKERIDVDDDTNRR